MQANWRGVVVREVKSVETSCQRKRENQAASDHPSSDLELSPPGHRDDSGKPGGEHSRPQAKVVIKHYKKIRGITQHRTHRKPCEEERDNRHPPTNPGQPIYECYGCH